MDTSTTATTVGSVSIVIVDDHPLVREGLGRVMADDATFRVVGEADSVEQALALPVDQVDVVTLDLSLPGIGGVDGIAVLGERFPTAGILVLTVHREDTHAAACAQRGAAGFLSKDAAPHEIRAAVTAIANGGQYYSANALNAILGGREEIRLSARELEVLHALAAGQRITDIATQMGVSVKTASTHKMRLQRKLGANNTAQIVVMARNRGLLS